MLSNATDMKISIIYIVSFKASMILGSEGSKGGRKGGTADIKMKTVLDF